MDSGCSRTILAPAIPKPRNKSDKKGAQGYIIGFNGETVKHEGEELVRVDLACKEVSVGALRSSMVLPGVDVILGMDVLAQHRVTFDKGFFSVAAAADQSKQNESSDRHESSREFTNESKQNESGDRHESDREVSEKNAEHVVHGHEFKAWFDGKNWIVKWNWRDDPELKKHVAVYRIPEGLRERFEEGVQKWIDEGWLVERDGELWGGEGLIPLMVVEQLTKQKVRPVLDYRELNTFISSSGARADFCDKRLREWRCRPAACTLLDLSNAYMQIRVHSDCSRVQLIQFKGKTYELTRMGFGLSCAPEVLRSVVSYVLGREEWIKAATSAFYDDILVDLTLILADEVADHLRKFGLETKAPKKLDGNAALGLEIHSGEGGDQRLRWRRPTPVRDTVTLSTTKRELFGLCGRITSHFPIAGWARAAAGMVKRLCADDKWDKPLNASARACAEEMLSKLAEKDPVNGVWNVDLNGRFRVWCDASDTATAAVLECNDEPIEDGTWLRRKRDPIHINIAELIAVLKGVKMAVRWKMSNLEILTDNAAVFYWLESVRVGEKKVRVSGDGELLVKRRLEIIRMMLEDANVEWKVTLVESQANNADHVSRVPDHWTQMEVCAAATLEVARGRTQLATEALNLPFTRHARSMQP